MTNEHGIYDSKEYKKSRFAYKMECTFEYFVALLVADAYLSSLLSAIGMPDAMVGTAAMDDEEKKRCEDRIKELIDQKR